MLRRLIFAAALALFALGQAQDVAVEKYHLDNGMTVILHEDHTLPIVALNLWYHVGSKDEPPHRSGFAHLFEHLMFMGSTRVPDRQFDGIMENSGGTNNATTEEDRTNFFDSGPSSLLPTLLWLEADRMEALGKAMTQKKLDLQREIVKNERRENYDNHPYGLAHLAVNGIMFPEGHPYHIPVIGTYEDLNAASVQEVKDFFATYYVPNNVSMVVAGDFSSKDVKPLIASLFGTMPRQNDPIHREAGSVQFEGVHRVTLVDNVLNPKIIMVWHSAPNYTKGDTYMDLSASVLADGVSSRLYQRLVADKELASEVTANQDSLMLGSLFFIEITPQSGASLDEVEKETDDVLATYLREGPKADELKRQTAKFEYATLSGLESLTDVADKLNEYEYFLGEPNSFKRVLDGYRNATPRQVRDEARTTLRLDARLVMRVLPTQTPPPANPRDKRPAETAQSLFSLPKPSQFTLLNGIKVNYWHRSELPLMHLSTVFKDPGMMDPPNKGGRTNLTATMLEQGAGSLDAATLENSLALLGADINFNSSRHGITAELLTLSPNFDKALDLYSSAVQQPRFDADDWSRVKKTHLSDLQEEFANAPTIAQHVSSLQLFGPDNPYGVPMEGTPETVNALKMADLKDVYRRTMRPENATIFAAGSLDEKTVRDALNQKISAWKVDPVHPGATPEIKFPQSDALQLYIVDKPDAPQTVIRFASHAPNSSDPRRLSLEALSAMFGGTFTSRLNRNLREDKGYAYGAGSNIFMDPMIGVFIATSNVRADVTGPAVKEFLAEIARIRTGDVTEEEARKAQLSLRSDLVQSLSGASGIVDTAIGTWLDDRPFAALDDDLAAIAKIRAADLNAVAKSAVQPEHGILVLVGDKAQILKQLEGLNLPAPMFVDPR